MNMTIREVWEEAHNNYLTSVNNNKLFEKVRKKSEKMARQMMNKCKKKKNSK
jgi:hypothetical protein